MNLMLPKEERRAMLLRLYNDETPLIDHSQARKQAAAAAAAEGAEEMVVDAEPETAAEEDGGVSLNADVDEDIQEVDATAPERVSESDELNKTE